MSFQTGFRITDVIAKVDGVLIAILGLLALAGWILGISLLAALGPEWIPLSVSLITALLFSASAMLGLLWRHQRARHYQEHVRDAEALATGEVRYQTVIQSAIDGIVSADRTGMIVGWNAAAERMFGYTESEVMGQPLILLLPERYQERHLAGMKRVQSGGERHIIGKTVELAGRRKDASEFPLELSLAEWAVGIDQFFTATIRDITERKAAEAKIQREKQLYAALSYTNQAIVHCTSEEELFSQICRASVQFGGMKMAWIGFADTKTRKVNPVTSFGDDSNYLGNIDISLDAGSPFGNSPTGIAIREDRPMWCQDFVNDPTILPWRERGIRAGIAALAALPLHRNGVVIGAFVLYSTMTDAFDEQARTLLIEMATDIDFALDNFVREAERKQMEEKLIYIQKAVESTSEAIGISDAQGHHFYQNKAFTALYGYANAEELEAVGGGAATVKDPEVVKEMYEMIMSGRSWSGELDVVHKNGCVFPAYERADAVKDNEGKIIGLVGIISDISERKQLETEKERYFKFFNTSTDLMCIADHNGYYKKVNAAFIRALGYSEIELLAEPFNDFVHPDDQQRTFDSLSEQRERGYTHDFENRYRCKDGSYKWLSWSVGIDKDEGINYAVYAVAHDITERKQSELALLKSEERYRLLASSTFEGIVISEQGRIVDCNDQLLAMLGYSRDEFIGKLVADLIPVEDRDRVLRNIQGGIESWIEHDMAHKNGRHVIVEAQGRNSEIDGHRQRHTVIRDITERKKAEEHLRKLSMAVEQSTESIVITNLKAEIEYVNDAFVKITGYSREEVIGQNPRILNSGKTPPETYKSLWDSISKGIPWDGEFHNQHKDGSEYFEHALISPIRQADGSITHYVAVKEDITDQKMASDMINTLAFYDTLTGLPNRRLLLDRLKHVLAAGSRSKRIGALLFIDLDNFKTLNDTLGHDVGDLLLQQVAQRLTSSVREGDTVARFGGDEFVIMLENLSDTSEEAAAQAQVVGDKIMATLNQTYQLDNYFHRSTPSIGIALFSEQQQSVDELLKQADLAMYQAKAAGRNTLIFFNPEMQTLISSRAVLEEDLREAVQKDQFLLYYQPQVVGDGRLTGVEVLLRWQHPQRGMVPPGEFIPLAEETGLILPIGHWVLETACHQLAKWAGQPEMAHLTIAVNVSARQFGQPIFVDEVLAILEQCGANPSKLKLELTESILLNDVEGVITKMSALKMKGVGFSLDDFGTGYSSLSYLKRLPLDQLKIDQGFVRNILTDPDDAAIAKMVVALAESMGLSVIAEGVEMEAQRDFLARHGCHAYQGYLFGRPIPLEEFENSVAKVYCRNETTLS